MLLWGSENPWLAGRLPRLRFVRRAVQRFMPGEHLEDALEEAAALASRGVPSTVTLLGENVENSDEATAVADEFLRVLDGAEHRNLDVEVSVKLTHLGLDQDPGRAGRHVARIARHAEGRGRVWIDMEASQYVDATLDVFRGVRGEHENVGLCLQSYLYRTESDLESLLPLDPAIRLVKGAYAEPPSVAFPKKRDADASFELLATRLLDHFAGGGSGFLVLGTHDERLVARTRNLIAEREVGEGAYEFAMLYGIGRRQQEALVRDGAPLRVLISYGSAWFPWYMRRLAERPANVWFVLRTMFR
jgi:proline dehydrogenase